MVDRSRIRSVLDQRLSIWRSVAQEAPVPPRGWLRAIREALGMSRTDLGRRIGLSRQRVAQIEQGEVEGSTTIGALRRTAEALDCSFVYAFVPKDSLESFVRRQADWVARQDVGRATHTMLLEGQDEPEDAERLVAELTDELSRSRDLWRR
jgi:predicted DNA-binding mobile mystery protein A